MKKLNKITLIIALIIFFSVVGVYRAIKESNVTKNNDNKLQVTTSFYPLYFFASQIGGNKTDVQNITPSGAEPHDYEPTAQDIARIEKSNLLILNGGNLEAWGGKIQDNLKGTKVLIIIAGKNITNQQVVEDGKSILDPHIWLSPPLATKEANIIFTVRPF